MNEWAWSTDSLLLAGAFGSVGRRTCPLPHWQSQLDIDRPGTELAMPRWGTDVYRPEVHHGPLFFSFFFFSFLFFSFLFFSLLFFSFLFFSFLLRIAGIWSQGCPSHGTVSRLQAGDQEILICLTVEARTLTLSHSAPPGSEAHPASNLKDSVRVMQGTKLTTHMNLSHSHESKTEDKNMWNNPPAPYVFVTWCLIETWQLWYLDRGSSDDLQEYHPPLPLPYSPHAQFVYRLNIRCRHHHHPHVFDRTDALYLPIKPIILNVLETSYKKNKKRRNVARGERG